MTMKEGQPYNFINLINKNVPTFVIEDHGVEGKGFKQALGRVFISSMTKP